MYKSEMKEDQQMKVFILTNVPVPYRVDFFNEIGKKCDLEVLFEQSADEQTHRSSNWFDGKFEMFKASFLYKDSEKRNVTKVTKFLKENKNNVIVIMGYSLPTEIYAISWLRFHRIPFILSCDGGFIKYHNDKKRLLKRFLVSSAKGYLSTGNATDDFLTYYGAKEDRLFRIPFTTLFERDLPRRAATEIEKKQLRSELGITESKVIVSVGQFIYRKGYDILINSCRNLETNVGIYIIGSEPTEEYLTMRSSLNLNNLHFVGFKKKDELSKYYKAADLFVLPTREDIWGLVINEAMAYGLPVITTERCIAGLELVDEMNGRIVPIDDSDSLTTAIVEVLANQKVISQMQQVSLSRIEGYTIENMALVHMRIFKDFYNRRVKKSDD